MEDKSINAGDQNDILLQELRRHGARTDTVVFVLEEPRLFQQDHKDHHHHEEHDHHQRRIPPGCKIAFKWAFGTLYVITDSNLDAFIFQEMIKYFTGDEMHCLMPWALGIGFNVIPNIPWTIAILSVLDHEHHHHDHENQNKIVDAIAHTGIFLCSGMLSVAASWNTINEFHIASQLSRGINGTITNIWTNCGALNMTGIVEQAPLEVNLPLSLFAGVIRGAGDLMLHGTIFHVSGGNPINQFKVTMWDYIWLTDHGIPWKLLITFAKLNIIIAHFALGYFYSASILDVTNLKAYLNEWLSILLCSIPGLVMALFEAITETFCIDRMLGIPAGPGREAIPGFNASTILMITKISLVLSAIIHTIPVGLEFSDWTYQSPKAIYNVLIFLGYMTLFGASSYGFYATTINENFDNIIRWLVCMPRRDAVVEIVDEVPKPDRRCCQFFRRRADRAPLLAAPAVANDNNADPPAEERGWCGIM